MPRATLTSKGQVTIPSAIREQLGLRAGDRLEFTLSPDGTVRVQPLGGRGEVRELRGILADRIRASAPPTVEQMREAVEEGAAAEFGRSVSHLRGPGDEAATGG